MAGLYLTQSAFAASRGWDRSRVSQLKKAEPSPIVFNEAGLVDVEATEAKLVAFGHADKQHVRDRHQRSRALADTPPAPPAGEDTPAGKDKGGAKDESFARFNAARAEREEENLAIARMERLAREGVLVRKDDVAEAAGEVAQVLVQGLDGLSVRLAPMVAAESDAVACQAIIDRAVRDLREKLAKRLRELFPDA